MHVPSRDPSFTTLLHPHGQVQNWPHMMSLHLKSIAMVVVDVIVDVVAEEAVAVDAATVVVVDVDAVQLPNVHASGTVFPPKMQVPCAVASFWALLQPQGALQCVRL